MCPESAATIADHAIAINPSNVGVGFIRLSGQNEKADYDECPFVRRSNSRLPKIRLLLEQLTFLAVPVEAR